MTGTARRACHDWGPAALPESLLKGPQYFAPTLAACGTEIVRCRHAKTQEMIGEKRLEVRMLELLTAEIRTRQQVTSN